MPGGDGTGPRGLGAGKGWGLGPCGAGMKRGYGMGFGWKRFAANQITEPTKEQEIQLLENERKFIVQNHELLKKELEDISKRIEELKK